MSHQQNAGQNCNAKVAGESFENMAKFGHLGITMTKQNCMHKEMKTLNSRNACCHLV
jgi:hypothetical protein